MQVREVGMGLQPLVEVQEPILCHIRASLLNFPICLHAPPPFPRADAGARTNGKCLSAADSSNRQELGCRCLEQRSLEHREGLASLSRPVRVSHRFMVI